MTAAAVAPRLHPAAWALALAAHLGVLAVLLPRARDLPAGPAFTVALSGFSGAPAADAPEEPADVAPEDPAAAPAEAPPPEAPAPYPAAAPQVPAPPPPLAAPIPPLAALPPPPPPVAAMPPQPPVPATPPREVAVATQTRSAARNAAPSAPAPATRPAARQAASVGTGQGTPAPAAPASPAARPSGGADAGLTQLPPDYAAAIARILRRGLRYPPPARDLGIEGTAMVRFAIARDGTIIAAQLVRGSGSALLDHEALALLRRVSPLPRLPEAVSGASAAVLVPIGFALN